MGNNQANHGTVTDYSMHHNMGTSAGRGFTFGSSRTAVSASINALTGTAQFNGHLYVGNGTSSYIWMVDTDHGNRGIHCNSNNIGFLNSSNGWGAYCTDAGLWHCESGLSVNGNFSSVPASPNPSSGIDSFGLTTGGSYGGGIGLQDGTGNFGLWLDTAGTATRLGFGTSLGLCLQKCLS